MTTARSDVLRILTAAIAIGATLLCLAAPAAAHPLGNFTVNRYARIEISGGILRVYYVLDEAEIPAFEDRSAVAQGASAFTGDRAATIRAGLTLTLDGAPSALQLRDGQLSQPAGQAGLHTLRLALLFEAPAPADGAPHAAVFTDSNEPARIGWREIVITSRGGGRLISSSAPDRDVSDELRHYPANLIQSPLDLRTARFAFSATGAPLPSLPLVAPASAPPRAGGSFARLITRHAITPLGLMGMLGLAALFGAAHALAPGHGKTIMAAYVVGGEGRKGDAALIGMVVAVMHTGSVLILGVILFQVSRSTPLDRVYPWLTLLAGLVIASYGALLVRRRAASRSITVRVPVATPVHHGHGDHDHGDHDHGPGGHSHELPAGVRPLSRQGLVMLATAGGLFPSPSALLVLVAAFTLHRIGLGLALIAAFSTGLAVTLAGVALALVYGGRMARRRLAIPAVAWLPVGAAVVVTGLGLAFVASGLRTLA